MTAQFHVDTDFSAHPSPKLLACTHAPSGPDRSYAELPATPPSPPHTIPPEFYHLRQCMLLNWVNHRLAASPPLATLAALLEGDTLIKLIAAVQGEHPPAAAAPGAQGLAAALPLLHAWLGRTTVELAVATDALARGDQDQLISLASLVLSQCQARTIHTLQDDMSALVGSHIPMQPHMTPGDLQQVLLGYVHAALADYAPLVPPISDCSSTAWQSGLLFLALLHWHSPASVHDLSDYRHDHHNDRQRWRATLDAAFRRAHDTFGVPILLDAAALADATHVDDESVLAYLGEFIIKAVPRIANDDHGRVRERRQSDIEHWRAASQHTDADPEHNDTAQCDTPAPSDTDDNEQPQQQQEQQQQQKQPGSFTITSTYTQVRLTKTTKNGADDKDDEFEAQVAALLEKIAQLQQRLAALVPTRSSAAGYAMHNGMSGTPDTMASPVDEASSSSIHDSEHSERMRRRLHPLEAGGEDLQAYEHHFAAFQTALRTFQNDDMEPFRQRISGRLDEQDSPEAQQCAQVQDNYAALLGNIDGAERELSTFRHGFAFARRCAAVRAELDAVQSLMVRMTAASTDDDIREMERRAERASAMVPAIPQAFGDLVTGRSGKATAPGEAVVHDNEHQDAAYQRHYDALVERSRLVRSWVAEVRVWFAEAGRIRQWIGIRMCRLDETTVPEPLKGRALPVPRETIDALNAAHAELQAEVDAFNKEDMARLRAHVKARTGASLTRKDLSPADTTTIEITLTTLAALDRLVGSLRAKGETLQVLTQRMRWEDLVADCNTWLTSQDHEVAEFVRSTARWQPAEDDLDDGDGDGDGDTHDHDTSTSSTGNDAAGGWRREQLLAQERLKELVVQRLLMLENARTEFDQGQFSAAVDAFSDMEDMAGTSLPAHLETRQTACEEHAEALAERIAYARQVVEQRLTVMDFMQQSGRVTRDARQLLAALDEAQHAVQPHDSNNDDSDRDMTARVQAMQEHIVQLATTAAARIPYPEPPTRDEADIEESTAANAATRDAVSTKRTALILLGDELDRALARLRSVLQTHRRGRQLLGDAAQLSTWAEERLRSLQSSAAVAATDALGMDELRRLERERDNLQRKLDDKENATVDVLTSIHAMLDAEPAPGDRSRLDDAAQHLTSTFDHLRETLDAHSRRLDALRTKLEDDTSHSEQLANLIAFVARTRAAVPGLKQTHGFITGQSETQDRERYEALVAAHAAMEAAFQENGTRLQTLRRLDMVRDAEPMRGLNKEWALLADELQHLQRFTDAVGGWCERQRRLSMVENELLNGLHENVAHLARSGWRPEDLQAIQRKVDDALRVLEGVRGEIAAASSNRDDPLETANYACARDRHAMLTSKAHAIRTGADALGRNADHAAALSEFLGRADALVAEVQAHTDMMRRRMSLAGHGDFASGSTEAIEQQCNDMQRDTAASETQAQKFRQRLQQLQRSAAGRGLDINGDSVREALARADATLGQLLDTVALEKRQAAFVRKTKIHAKAAGDLHSWIARCGDAVRQLASDVCIKDEAELRSEIEAIEHKMVEMQPVVRAFQAMPSRILAGRDGQPLNLGDMHIDPRVVRAAIQAREDGILDAWRELGNQLDTAKQRVQSAARHVETARKVKEILSLVGRLRERTAAVRISSTLPGNADDDNSDGDDDDDDDELAAVTTCPLSLLPTEHELLAARTELDAVERDIEQHLQARLAELDAMLSSNAESEDIFAGQRTEIAAALRRLTDMLRNKRAAADAAARLEAFLVVVEELEVLLSAMGEVVDRASPAYARTTVDGKPNRADLQGMLIDLDTRFRYYEPKIDELLAEARREATPLKDDDARVAQCVSELSDRWTQLQALAAARRSDLLARIGPLGPADLTTPPRRNASLAKRASMPSFGPQPSQSTPRPTSTRSTRPQSAMATHRPRAPSLRATAALSRRTAAASAARTTPTTAARPPPPSSRDTVQTPDTYVADPANDLDVALGSIVNDSPYKVLVKMVPGEVGRYWFGTRRPKMAYCRILRSRMVMVRVGGGWVELSQFLRDQKLLEDGDFVPHRPSPQLASAARSGPAVRDGVVSIRGGGGGAGNNKRRSMGPPPSPASESRSTPHGRGVAQTTFGHGVKEGNKFLIPVDGQGNQVEVRMTRARDKNTTFITPWR